MYLSMWSFHILDCKQKRALVLCSGASALRKTPRMLLYNYIKHITTQRINKHKHAERDELAKGETYSACRAQRQVVHLLG